MSYTRTEGFVTVTVPITTVSSKVDSLTGKLLKGPSFDPIFRLAYEEQPGPFMLHSVCHDKKSIRIHVHHGKDCPTRFPIEMEVNLKSGTVALKIPIKTGACSDECAKNR